MFKTKYYLILNTLGWSVRSMKRIKICKYIFWLPTLEKISHTNNKVNKTKYMNMTQNQILRKS
jgi:hypothetical protein